MSYRLEAALRACLWLLLGGWIGAQVYFAAGVAPSAFEVLGREAAGRLVAHVLPPLQLYGIAAGGTLALLALVLRRGVLAVTLPLVLTGLGLFSLFGITARMEKIRDLAFGPEADPAARALFFHLHAISGVPYLVIFVGGLVLAVVHARADALEARKKSAPLP